MSTFKKPESQSPEPPGLLSATSDGEILKRSEEIAENMLWLRIYACHDGGRFHYYPVRMHHIYGGRAGKAIPKLRELRRTLGVPCW